MVRLQVSDIGRSLAFYTSVLGLRADGPRAAGLSDAVPRGHTVVGLWTQDLATPLIELHERPGARPVPPRGRLGLFHVALLVPDRASLGRFVSHLAGIDTRVGAADHLVSEALYLWDPDGLGIEVYADRPRSEWAMNGDQLAMTTDPLDMPSVMRAGAGAPWNGMPAGTVIGHLHLSVGDIAAANAFYRLALGFETTVWGPSALFMSAGGYHHHLATNTWSAGAPRATDADARLLEWELVLPAAADVDEAAGRMASAGYAVDLDDADRLLTDPWGVALRLTSISPSERAAAWRG